MREVEFNLLDTSEHSVTYTRDITQRRSAAIILYLLIIFLTAMPTGPAGDFGPKFATSFSFFPHHYSSCTLPFKVAQAALSSNGSVSC